MKQTLLILIMAGMLSACPGPSEKKTDGGEDIVLIGDADVETMQCYTYINNNDTVWMHINPAGERVEGDLAYKFYEKDQNLGTLEGEMRGDTLFANYRFMSEGITSEREVTFLKRGDTFVEGYGDVEEKDGRMVLKNHTSLNFNSNTILQKVACDE